MNTSSAQRNWKEFQYISPLPFPSKRNATSVYATPSVPSETPFDNDLVYQNGNSNVTNDCQKFSKQQLNTSIDKSRSVECQFIPDDVIDIFPFPVTDAEGDETKCRLKETREDLFYFILTHTLKSCKNRLEEIRILRKIFYELFHSFTEWVSNFLSGKITVVAGINPCLTVGTRVKNNIDVVRHRWTPAEIVQLPDNLDSDGCATTKSAKTMSSTANSLQGGQFKGNTNKSSPWTSVALDTELKVAEVHEACKPKITLRAKDLLACYNNDKYQEELLYTLVDDFVLLSRNSVDQNGPNDGRTGLEASSIGRTARTGDEMNILTKSMEDSFEKFLQINSFSTESIDGNKEASAQIAAEYPSDASNAHDNSLSVLETGHNGKVEWSQQIEESLDSLLETISAPLDIPQYIATDLELPQNVNFQDAAEKEAAAKSNSDTDSWEDLDACGGCPPPRQRRYAGGWDSGDDDVTVVDTLETPKVLPSSANATGNQNCALSLDSIKIDDVRFPPSGKSDGEPSQTRDKASGDKSDKEINYCDNGHQQSRFWTEEEDRRDICFIKVPSIPAQQMAFHVNQNGVVKIGEGSFGTVFLADLSMHRAVYQVVVKDFSPKGVTKPREIIEEAKILMHLADTTFIPHFYGLLVVASPQRFALVQEFFARGMNLHHIIVENSVQLSQASWISICLQLAVGLDRFHRKGVLMNDIKKDNVLVDCRTQECVLKYVDMGLASYKCGRVFYGSEEYLEQFTHLAPEVRRLKRTSTASDVYSIGMILRSIADAGPLTSINHIVLSCLHTCPTMRPNIREVVCKLLTVNDCIYRSQPHAMLIANNSLKRWYS